MTIDEAINFVENMIYNYRPYGEQLEDWNRLLNLLRWYKGQDLIERERARIMCQFFYDEELRSLLTESIARLPKAEPPKEKTNDD